MAASSPSQQRMQSEQTKGSQTKVAIFSAIHMQAWRHQHQPRQQQEGLAQAMTMKRSCMRKGANDMQDRPSA